MKLTVREKEKKKIDVENRISLFIINKYRNHFHGQSATDDVQNAPGGPEEASI